MSVSVIVLSHQPGQWLEPCLASVLDQADEVVLVDNASAGGQAAIIGRRTGVRVIESPRNLGFAGGVNLGVRSVQSDVIALLNDDAVAGPRWLESAVAILNDPTVAAVTPKVLLEGWYRAVTLDDPPLAGHRDHRALGRQLRSAVADGTDVLDQLAGEGIHELETAADDRWRWTQPGMPFYVPVTDPGAADTVTLNDEPVPPGPVYRLINKAGGYLRADGVLGDRGAEMPDDGRWDDPIEPFFASGTAFVARAETFARVGDLAEPFFAYYEDGDWCWRARLMGMRVAYDPTSTVEHRHSATSGGNANPRVHFLANRNRTLTLVRNAPRSIAVAHVRKRWPGVAAKLPWAVASRVTLSRSWTVTPGAVWEHWAGRGVTE